MGVLKGGFFLKEKLFQDDIRNACKRENIGYYKLRDTPFIKKEEVDTTWRFTPNNICDIVISYIYTFYIELKSCKGESLSYRSIRTNQLKGLYLISDKSFVFAGLGVYFSKYNESYVISIQKLVEYMDSSDRKSIPYSEFKKSGFRIKGELKRTRYNYSYFI